MRANEKNDNTSGKAFKATKRRRGSFAAEIARDAQVSLHLVKQCIKIHKHAPELSPFLQSGALKCRDAVKILACARFAPEILPALANGNLNLDWFIQELRKRKPAPRLPTLDCEDFDERVEQSFKRWLNNWPKDSKTRLRLWQIVDDIFDELIK